MGQKLEWAKIWKRQNPNKPKSRTPQFGKGQNSEWVEPNSQNPEWSKFPNCPKFSKAKLPKTKISNESQFRIAKNPEWVKISNRPKFLTCKFRKILKSELLKVSHDCTQACWRQTKIFCVFPYILSLYNFKGFDRFDHLGF